MRRYSEDYELVVIKDEAGREIKQAVYRGKYFEVSLDERGLLQFRRYCSLLLAAIVLLHISGGFINNQGMYQFYISLPYVSVFIPLFYLAQGILNLPKEKRTYRRKEIGLSFDRLKTASILLIIFLGIGVIGTIIYLLFFSTQEQRVLEYIYLSLEILAASAAYILIRLQKPIRVQPCIDQQED